MSTPTEFGRGKTILITAVVIGCIVLLWPRLFFSSNGSSISQSQRTQGNGAVQKPAKKGYSRSGSGESTCCDVISEKDTNAYTVMNEICKRIMSKHEQMLKEQREQEPQSKQKKHQFIKPPSMVTLCRNEILQNCGVDITGLLKEDHSITQEYKKSLGQLRTFNTSLCIKLNYGVDFREMGLPRKIKGPEATPSYMRPERLFRPSSDLIHPALLERGRAIPTIKSTMNIPRKTIERETRPPPMPVMRPPIGRTGYVPPQTTPKKGSGSTGTLMPLYTIGIAGVILFTIVKVTSKKTSDKDAVKSQESMERKYSYSYPEVSRTSSEGKSSGMLEDRRKLDSPTVIYPQYPSELETETITKPSTAPLTSTSVASSSPAQNEPEPESVLRKDSVEPTPTIPISSSFDEVKTSPPAVVAEEEIVTQRLTKTEIMPETESHDEKHLHDESLLQSSGKDVKEVPSDKRHELSRDVSVCSSADTIIAAGNVDESPKAEEEAKESNVFKADPAGPFSPLVPETPNPEDAPSHFFDRTIVIPDYEPRKGSISLEQAPPEPQSEPEQPKEEPELTIVKEDSIPENVMSLALQVAERILEDAKLDASTAGEPLTSPTNELDDYATGCTPPEPDFSFSEKPRLSLDTVITKNTNSASLAEEVHDSTNIELAQFDKDDELEQTLPTRKHSDTPEIQVETPHADQTELNKIAEFLETLNVEPKESEKLTPPSLASDSTNSNEPIVTLADEIKEGSKEDPIKPPPPLTSSTKSKIEITPFDETQLVKQSIPDLPDICYVTQPLDDSQKSKLDKSKILRSTVEIVSFDEGSEAPKEKQRKTSEPLNVPLESKKSTDTLDQAKSRLKHVPEEEASGGSDAAAEGRSRRRSSAASDHSQDSHKASEIDKYVSRMAGMQETRRQLIEQRLMRGSASRSSQDSETGDKPDQDQEQQQSSNFHGPAFLDSGQIKSEVYTDTGQIIILDEMNEDDKMKEIEKWADACIIDDPPEKIPDGEMVFDLGKFAPEIVNFVNSLIDQALHDGIHRAVDILVELEMNGTFSSTSLPETDTLTDADKPETRIPIAIDETSSSSLSYKVEELNVVEKNNTDLDLGKITEESESSPRPTTAINSDADIASTTITEAFGTKEPEVVNITSSCLPPPTPDSPRDHSHDSSVAVEEHSDTQTEKAVVVESGKIEEVILAVAEAGKVIEGVKEEEVYQEDQLEPIISELETIQEEIETLSTEINKMEDDMDNKSPVTEEAEKPLEAEVKDGETTESVVSPEKVEEKSANEEEDLKPVVSEDVTVAKVESELEASGPIVTNESEKVSEKLEGAEEPCVEVAVESIKSEDKEAANLAALEVDKVTENQEAGVTDMQIVVTESIKVDNAKEIVQGSPENVSLPQPEELVEVSESKEEPQFEIAEAKQEASLENEQKALETREPTEPTEQNKEILAPSAESTVPSEICEGKEAVLPEVDEQTQEASMNVPKPSHEQEAPLEIASVQNTVESLQELPNEMKGPDTIIAKLNQDDSGLISKEITEPAQDIQEAGTSHEVVIDSKLEALGEIAKQKIDVSMESAEQNQEGTSPIQQMPEPGVKIPEEGPATIATIADQKQEVPTEEQKTESILIAEETEQITPEAVTEQQLDVPTVEQTTEPNVQIIEENKSQAGIAEQTPEALIPSLEQSIEPIAQITEEPAFTEKENETAISEQKSELPNAEPSAEPSAQITEEVIESEKAVVEVIVEQKAEVPPVEQVTESSVQTPEECTKSEKAAPEIATKPQMEVPALEQTTVPSAQSADESTESKDAIPEVIADQKSEVPAVEQVTEPEAQTPEKSTETTTEVPAPILEQATTPAVQTAEESTESEKAVKEGITEQEIPASSSEQNAEPTVQTANAPIELEQTAPAVIPEPQPELSEHEPKEIPPKELETKQMAPLEDNVTKSEIPVDISETKQEKLTEMEILEPLPKDDVVVSEPDKPALTQTDDTLSQIAPEEPKQEPAANLSQQSQIQESLTDDQIVAPQSDKTGASEDAGISPEIAGAAPILEEPVSEKCPTLLESQPQPVTTETIVANVPEESQVPGGIELHFEPLSEPPFPIPPSTNLSNTDTEQASMTMSTGFEVVDNSSILNSPTSSTTTGPRESMAMALVVELLDENSPEAFPLTSPPQEPPSEGGANVDNLRMMSGDGVSLSTITRASTSDHATTNLTMAEQLATQATSAIPIEKSSASTTTTIISNQPQGQEGQSSSAEKLADSEIPISPPPPPTTPAVNLMNEPPKFPTSVTQPIQAQEIKEPVVTAEKGIVDTTNESRIESVPSATEEKPSEIVTKSQQRAEEDLEKLIGKSGSSPTQAEVPLEPPIKPERTKRAKSFEKEVKFKLPPEELDDEEIEQEIDIVRPPTPPKTLSSKAKPKTPSPTPEYLGSHSRPLTPSSPGAEQSYHRETPHDELLISSMETAVAGSETDNSTTLKCHSPSAAIIIIDSHNNTTSVITPTSRTTSPTSLVPPPYQKIIENTNATIQSQVQSLPEGSGGSRTIIIVENSNSDQNKQTIAQAKAAASSASSPPPGVSVVGIEETASLSTGERWDLNRTPTPTFRAPPSPVPHRPPTPPEQIPSIYLEGPMSYKQGQELVVREAQIEVEATDDMDDDDYEPSGPVILSGKVTLSVISSAAGFPHSHDEITDAPSLSLDDRARAEQSKRNATEDIASTVSKEVIGKGGNLEDPDDPDVSLDDFLTATDAEQDGDRAQEDTANDISTMDDLKVEPLPKD